MFDVINQRQTPDDAHEKRRPLVPINSDSAMESNRDEAERCIGIALAAIKLQNKEKALRFLEKAQRLFPTDQAQGKKRYKETGGSTGGGRVGSGAAVTSHLLTAHVRTT